MREYYPTYTVLTEAHAKAMAAKDTDALRKAEAAIDQYKKTIFCILMICL